MTSGVGSPGPSTKLWAPGTRSLVVGVFGLMTFIAFESFAVTTALPVVAQDLDAAQWYSLPCCAGSAMLAQRGPAGTVHPCGLGVLTTEVEYSPGLI